MNRNRLLFIGIVALVLGALVSYVVYSALRRTVASVREANTPVVIAAADLQIGTKLQDKDVREIKLPGNELPQGLYIGAGNPLGHGLDRLALAVQQQPLNVNARPVAPLSATQWSEQILKKGCQSLIERFQLPWRHGRSLPPRESEVKTNLT